MFFFALFSSRLDRIMLILHGFEELFTQHKLAHKLSLTIKTDDVTEAVERKWIRTGDSGVNGLK